MIDPFENKINFLKQQKAAKQSLAQFKENFALKM